MSGSNHRAAQQPHAASSTCLPLISITGTVAHCTVRTSHWDPPPCCTSAPSFAFCSPTRSSMPCYVNPVYTSIVIPRKLDSNHLPSRPGEFTCTVHVTHASWSDAALCCRWAATQGEGNAGRRGEASALGGAAAACESAHDACICSNKSSTTRKVNDVPCTNHTHLCLCVQLCLCRSGHGTV